MGAEERVALEWRERAAESVEARAGRLVLMVAYTAAPPVRRGHETNGTHIYVWRPTLAEAQAECERIARAAGLLPPAPPPAEGPRP